MSGSKLLDRLQAGDPGAFRELVDNHKAYVLNTCYRFVNNQEDAEDISQEVFVEVYNSISGFRADAKLSTWLYRIAVNKSLDYIRRKKRKKRFAKIIPLYGYEDDEEIGIPADNNPVLEFEDQERRKLLNEAVGKLPENQQVVINLSKYQRLSNKEIAAVMNISLSAVESLNHRAKINLRRYLHHYFEKNI